jgi:hypothetical protein
MAVDAAALLPHPRRGALLVLSGEHDLLAVAEAIARDDSDTVSLLLESGRLVRPSLSDVADWCVDEAQRLQFLIIQPFVIAQLLPRGN